LLASVRQAEAPPRDYRTELAKRFKGIPPSSLDDLVAAGVLRYDPIVYEDFLPVSAAGIFQSNLHRPAAELHRVPTGPRSQPLSAPRFTMK
jgi:uncharacterized glyoxalase superfamily metalloenzyme YdcJ